MTRWACLVQASTLICNVDYWGKIGYITHNMKVGIVSNIYPPFHRGGAEQVVVKTVEQLKSAGHEVVVITGTPHASERLQENGVTVHRIHPTNLFFYTQAHEHGLFARALWHLIDMWHVGVARQVKRILVEEEVTVVHTHNLMGLSFLIPRAIRSLGLPHVHTVHDVQLVEPSGIILKQSENTWRYNGLMTKIYTAIMRKLMGSPQVVISPSTFLKNFYLERSFFLDSDVTVVRNPMTFVLDSAEYQENEDNTLHCLYVGQVEKHKGMDVLVHAMESITQDEYIHLDIVGSGASLAQTVDLLGDHPAVTIHGKVDRTALPALFRAADVCIVPSLCYENSPTVIFESFSFGVPVIASDIEGVAELVEEGENGWTVQAGDSFALAEKMRWCGKHREILHGMRTKIQQRVAAVTKVDYGAELIRLYHQACESR